MTTKRSADIEELHENIREGCLELEVLKIYKEKYPKDRRGFNRQFESALKISLLSNRLESYELLLQNGFELGSHEDLNAILDKLGRKRDSDGKLLKTQKVRLMEEKLLKIHKRCSKDSRMKHLQVLESMTKLSHNTPDCDKNLRKMYSNKIMEAYGTLNEIKCIEPILRVVASSKVCEIIFDFTRNSVDKVDPTANESVMGVACL